MASHPPLACFKVLVACLCALAFWLVPVRVAYAGTAATTNLLAGRTPIDSHGVRHPDRLTDNLAAPAATDAG